MSHEEFAQQRCAQQLTAGAGPVQPPSVQQAANYARQQDREDRYEAEQREQRIQSRDDTMRQAALHGALVALGACGDAEIVIRAARAMEAFLRGESGAETTNH